MVTILVDMVILGSALAIVLTSIARHLGLGLTATEGLRDIVDGWLYDFVGVTRTPSSLIAQLRRQVERLRLAVTPGRVFGPGRVHIELHPDEHAQLRPLGRAAGEAVAAAAMSAARRNGWQTHDTGPVIQFIAMTGVRRGRPQVHGSDWVARGRRDGHTGPLTAGGSPSGVDLPTPLLKEPGSGDTTVGLTPRRPGQPAVRLTAPGGAGATLTAAAASVVIGRGSAADLRVTESGVSRAHTRITWHPAGAQVEDLGSTNGTYVDGVRLDRPHLVTGPATLGLGDSGPELAVELLGSAVTGAAGPGAGR